ncbi:MAG: phenylacetate--CoA ligase family protein, partial [Xanthomarina gelatinilytica]|nr:phenylacetate--CoA ligase family protein [Xanthomarina gelatinilytica]
MNLFDLSLKFSGFPIEKAETALQNIQQIKNNDYQAYVNEKKQNIVEFHLKHTPFYNALAKN